MPTISIKKRLLDKHLSHVYSDKEIDELCFQYGLEVDDIVMERNEETGKDEQVFKIEVPANRYDLLCVEGLCRALLVFLRKLEAPKYTIAKEKKPQRIIVEPETAEVRPFVVGAILRGVHFDEDIYNSFIDLQDKLHQNIGRKRTLVSMGTHDLDHIKGTIRYRALKPQDISFKPLNQDRVFTAAELMDFYANSHLKEYLPIIKDKAVYPVFYDENDVVLSLPPVINGDHTKITMKTTNIFIEITGTDLKKVEVTLDTLVTMFSQYCKTPFTVEPVEVVYAKHNVRKYPLLEYREQIVDVPRMNTKIGLPLTSLEVVELLSKMCLICAQCPNDPNKIKVTVPPTRHDILHECDIAEDLGLAYGYNNIVPGLPSAHTVAEPLRLNKLTDQLRINMAAAGWTEVLNFALCSTEDVSTKLRRSQGELNEIVKISNPKTLDFQVVRNRLIPGILKTLSSNRDMPVPLKLFEIQDVLFIDTNTDTNCRNERHLAAVYYSKVGGFEKIHGLLDRVMQVLAVSILKNNSRKAYSIREVNDPTFFDGRCAEVVYDGRVIGIFGVLHPEVLANYSLNMLCSALEINIEPFL